LRGVEERKQLQNITREEWRRGENYRTLPERNGGEGKSYRHY
jgi:hypothetical protein